MKSLMDKLRETFPDRAEALGRCETRQAVRDYIVRRRGDLGPDYPTDLEIWAWRERMAQLDRALK